jgi:hypothetical protein
MSFPPAPSNGGRGVSVGKPRARPCARSVGIHASAEGDAISARRGSRCSARGQSSLRPATGVRGERRAAIHVDISR